MSAGEDTFELHSVQLKLEAVEKQIRDLVEKQAQLRERRAALQTSRADAHKSRVSIQRTANTPTTSTPCVSLHRPRKPRTRSSQMSFTPAPGHHGHWVHLQTSPPPPPPVFEISTRNCFIPLHKTERDAVIVGDSIIRHVRATLLRQTETLKRDFGSLIETVCSTSPVMTIIMSGPLPPYQRGHERFTIYWTKYLGYPDKLYKKQSEDKEMEPEVAMEEAHICVLRVCRK
uniref:Uncharacterized protein n=1 Tax=Sinocyclocheilus rhinocerous TaxID=307959 RepID=A0A673IZ52_9TELE